MESKAIRTICGTINDEVYTTDDAMNAWFEVVALIKLEEKSLN